MQPETALLFWWLNILNKKRYDALDIEYAQLYEKFAEQQG